MNADERQLAAAALCDLLARHVPVPDDSRAGEERVWIELVAAGFTEVGAAGSGSSFADAVSLVAAVSGSPINTPLAEQLLVTSPAMQITDAGLESAPLGAPAPLALGSWHASRSTGRWLVDGAADDVAWVAAARSVLALADTGDGEVLVALPTAGCSQSERVNLAGETRTSIAGVQIEARAVAPVSAEQAETIRCLPAFARAVQAAGTLRTILELTLRYALERQQFRKPIFDFQLVKSGLAAMAGHVEAVEAVVGAAAEAGPQSSAFRPLAAAAKVRAGAGIDSVTATAHQIHGAMGMTAEYPLQLHTRRCWSWRDEAGSPNHWALRLADQLLRAELWPALAEL